MRSDPDWIVPGGLPESVGALMTTRTGGFSAPPWDSMNLGIAVGDDAAAVQRNRARLAEAIGAVPRWLRHVHGARVVRLAASDAGQDAPPEADASVTTERGVACVVQVADCLPVLLAAADGRAVAVAHAGWRGLAAGVVEAALQALCEAADCAPRDVHAWLGPCIGPRRFEVGADVFDALGGGARLLDAPGSGARFAAAPVGGARFAAAPGGGARFVAVPGGRWLADLAGLARDRLAARGVERIAGSRWCTVEDRPRFYSFRRDDTTGRMAAAIWRR